MAKRKTAPSVSAEENRELEPMVAHFDETFRVPFAKDMAAQRTRTAVVVDSDASDIVVVIEGRRLAVPRSRVLFVDMGEEP